MASTPSLKRLQTDKENRTMIVAAAIASCIVIFVLISGHTLIGQMSFHSKVISAKQTAYNQLQQDIIADNRLNASYQQFAGKSTNIIGGSSTGTGAKDGDNGKVILDALPSQYDFPALTTSIQSLLSSQGVNIDGITGTDEQASVSSSGAIVATSGSTSTTTSTPIGDSIAMPFQFNVDGSYQSIENLFTTFEASIRPFQFQTFQISGNQSDLTLSVTAQTFYQPQQDFTITSETVQ
jgi:Tfp pilus assembly protein PilO